jgi:AcrR family transcriptional regulator
MRRTVNEDDSQGKRRYHAPRRTAAAAATRQAILRAAKDEFEAHGWAATTIRSIATRADVSPKTVEALFATKAALLEATLVVAFGADDAGPLDSEVAILRPEAVLEVRGGDAALEMEEARDAATMLELSSALARQVNSQAVGICWAIEAAVPGDERLAEVWERLIAAQRFGVHWTAELVLQKPGARAGLILSEAEETILTACDWNTYRALTTKGGMTPDDAQAWTMRYYRRMLLG